ncbi:MAG: hypothetical protein KDC84_09905 [Crocinitomicaceae bacterium]|nr:hypothetical protein [Crocinitomicaceae bacterium]
MTKSVKLILLFLILFSLGSCKKERTSWDTEWAVPLAYGTLDLNDMIQDSIFAVNPDSTLNLIYTGNIVDLNFDSIFKIPDTILREKIALSINLDVPPGTSFINQVEERQFDIEGAQIKELGIKSGGATITVKNPIATGVYLTLTLPGVQKQGSNLSVTAFVPAGSSANPATFSLDVDFTGYMMDLRGANGNSWNTITSVFDATSDPNGDTVFVTNQDSITIEVAFQDILPDYGRGYFGNQIFSAQDTIDLEFMRNFVSGSILIDSVNMNLNIRNGLVVIATGVVNQLTSINTNYGNTVNLNHSILGQNININPASGAWSTLSPFIYPININSGNSNIQSFLQNLPDKLIMDYNFQINPLGNVSGGNDYFYPQSELAVELELNMPTRFSTSHLYFIDTFNLEINQNPESTRITNGELILSGDNYFPFDLHANLIFLDDQGMAIDTLFASGSLVAGIPDFNGKVNMPTFSEVSYLVDQNFMQVIDKAKSIVVWADVNNTNHPLAYDLYDYYSIQFKIRSNIGLKVEF